MHISFGKNLKKIRSVHNLSQQIFADIFDLKRGTLGAYEEGRSNPKLETVIKIANHFSIGIEELLTGELTVNRLVKFNERITTEKEAFTKKDFDGIPCILLGDKPDCIFG
jgi:DNA-binding XRE family transcriptional regulator